MKIHRVSFSNFRTFGDFALDLEGRSAFVVSENGGGKTSLLTGIARALGRDLNFSRADFADPGRPIELRAVVSDLDASQRGVFVHHVLFGNSNPTLELQVRATWNADAEEAEIEHGYARDGSRSRRNERDAIHLQWLPSGRDPSRMLQFGVARNLMSRLVETLPIEGGLHQAIRAIQEAASQLGGDESLHEFLRAARDELSQLQPEVSSEAFTMAASATTQAELLRQFELVLQHLGEPVPVDRQSSGLAQLAIFVFAGILAARDPGMVLLVDEPEISLHPQSQRALLTSLRKLDRQMIIATHSANLLDRVDPRDVIRLRRVSGGVQVVRPTGINAADAIRVARFTTAQAAEALFARKVVLVEGLSDQLALESVAAISGRNLNAEGVALVPINGARTIATFLQLMGPQGLKLELAGLCDEAQEGDFARALRGIGLATNLTRAEMAEAGFYVCVRDLEDELIRALGIERVEEIIDAHGDLQTLRIFQAQPSEREVPVHDQLRSFIASRGRKIEYVPILAEALERTTIPEPLAGVLEHV